MHLMTNFKLDNPVWYSLLETHQNLAIDYGTTKFYHPAFCPFGGYESMANVAQHCSLYAKETENFFIVGDKPILPDFLEIKKDVLCLQMVMPHKIEVTTEDEIILLDASNREEIFRLVTTVLPGYFREKTSSLGNYFGIFREGKLVAVSGERMQMDDYIEISAVATHPNYTGQGLAFQLVAHTANKIIEQNKQPFLHTADNNDTAIRLYEKLGFTTRRKISFWLIGRK